MNVFVCTAQLKRGTYGEARASSRQLATQLGLQAKLGAQCRQLSGGMQRRAQLACALAGGATVLILDEPTSGLDVETRRELWDLLLVNSFIYFFFMKQADNRADVLPDGKQSPPPMDTSNTRGFTKNRANLQHCIATNDVEPQCDAMPQRKNFIRYNLSTISTER
uniref:SFRICE_039628 n=1 Tax=Spodoptera frugiperda TaxID=7108 RepID=A0A2H1WME4_SPOFR